MTVLCEGMGPLPPLLVPTSAGRVVCFLRIIPTFHLPFLFGFNPKPKKSNSASALSNRSEVQQRVNTFHKPYRLFTNNCQHAANTVTKK
jgi:hypothetical protein